MSLTPMIEDVSDEEEALLTDLNSKFSSVSVKKVHRKNGMVELSLVAQMPAGTSMSYNEILFKIPKGFRPTSSLLMLAMANDLTWAFNIYSSGIAQAAGALSTSSIKYFQAYMIYMAKDE